MAAAPPAVQAFWVASFPDGFPRPRRPRGGDGDLGSRPRQKLPPVKWLREKLCAAGGEAFDAETLAALGGGRKKQLRRVGDSNAPIFVNALVRVTAAECAYEAGPLTPCHQEGELLREYFDSALDCYELRITDMRQVCEPVNMVLKGSCTLKGEGFQDNHEHSSARVNSHTHL